MKLVRIARAPLAAAVLAAALAACVTQPAPQSVPRQNPGLPAAGAQAPGQAQVEMPLAQCDAAPAQFAIGQQLTNSLLEDARRAAGAPLTRVLRPGAVMTMDFNGGRLNVTIDAGGAVTAVRCG